jgi:hypothetical protein
MGKKKKGKEPRGTKRKGKEAGSNACSASLTHGVCIGLTPSEMFVPFTFEQVRVAKFGPQWPPPRPWP